MSTATYNQITPYGSSIWSGNTQINSLSPNQQKILNQQENYSLGVGDKINNGLYSIGNFGVDQSQLPTLDTNAGQSVYDAYMSRLTPQFEAENGSFDQQMANQGLAPGTQAYDNAYRNLSNKQNDLRVQALSNAATAQNNIYNTALNGQVTIGNTPINQMNALRNGLTLNNPTFSNSGTSPQYAADTAQSNADTAANNNLMNGLFGLGGAALLSRFWA